EPPPVCGPPRTVPSGSQTVAEIFTSRLVVLKLGDDSTNPSFLEPQSVREHAGEFVDVLKVVREVVRLMVGENEVHGCDRPPREPPINAHPFDIPIVPSQLRASQGAPYARCPARRSSHWGQSSAMLPGVLSRTRLPVGIAVTATLQDAATPQDVLRLARSQKI